MIEIRFHQRLIKDEMFGEEEAKFGNVREWNVRIRWIAAGGTGGVPDLNRMNVEVFLALEVSQ